MKKLFLLLLCTIGVLATTAQNYVAKKDTLWGSRYYILNPATGQPQSTGNKTSTSQLTWPTQQGLIVKYYIHLPAGHNKIDMVYTPKRGTGTIMDVTLTNMTTKKVVYEEQFKTSYILNPTETTEELIPDFVADDAWYQIKLVCPKSTNAISKLKMFLFSHESSSYAAPNTVFMAPSAHNNSWTSTDPQGEQKNKYDWAYGEFLYPDEYAFPNRYLMCIGGNKYYSGIQCTGSGLVNKALFSAWDNGDTDKDPNLPSYLRSCSIDNNTSVEIKRFGGEGTGVRCMIHNAHWKRGHWVQWLINCRPETTPVTLKTKDGRDSVITYNNTIMSAWYKMADDPDWCYISTIRQSGYTHLFGAHSDYSFLENYSENGNDLFVRCYMKNRFFHAVGDGKWYNRNHMTPGHYNYNDGVRECRYDYGHGATELYENCFYIEHGGFGQVNDSSMYVPLATNTECVDTINLDTKQARINQAFLNNNYKHTVQVVDSLLKISNNELIAYAKELIDNAGEVDSYADKYLENIKTAYNEGNPSDINALANAIKTTAQEHLIIRYANVTQKYHIGSNRSYILKNTMGVGVLYADMEDGKPVLKVGKMDREDARANWSIVISDKYGTTTFYNQGLGLFLNYSAENFLSETPQDMAYFARYGQGFYIGTYSFNCLVTNEEGTVQIGSYRDKYALFFLEDNLQRTSSVELQKSLVEQTEIPGKFAEYKALVPSILSAPEGVVGSWASQDQLEALETLYDDGNITADKAQELITLMDNADKVTFESGTYYITSADNANESSPYLTIDADNSIYHRTATNKPDQIWFASPKRGGFELSSQGRSLGSLADNSIVTVPTKAEGEGKPYFFTEQTGGQQILSDIQNGNTLVDAASTPIRSAYSSTTANSNFWYVKPAKEVKVTLNSSGLLTLYLDFDVKLPEGLQAFKLDGFDADGALLTPVEDGNLPARTPVILRGDNYGQYMLTIVPEQNFPTEPSLLQGTLLKKTGLKSKTFYTIGTKNGQPAISLALTTSVTANQCYILKEDMDSLGFTETTYPIDWDNITAVKSVKTNTTTINEKAYDLQGRETDANAEGIIIRKNKKVLNK